MSVRDIVHKLHPVFWLPMSKTQRLRWHIARSHRFYRREMAKARRLGHGQDKRDEIQHGYWADTEELHQNLEELRTRGLTSEAHRLDVSYPPPPWSSNEQRDEFWERGNMTGEWYLTTRGFNKVRTDIRTEIRARHEARAHWVAWISAITGLVGALTGLAAILSNQ